LIEVEKRFAIEDLYSAYASCLDSDQLEEWLDLFIEKCVYKIIPKQNVTLGLPVTLMLCENKNMLRDRIVSLRQANEYSIHTDKHLISNVCIKTEVDPNTIMVEANYALFQADNEGNGSLYSFGTYIDEVLFVENSPKFLSKTVIVENWSIPHMLSTPI
jgi:anthranilate 1,2-dioxygenase small subunit|tara:strand:- start:17 stop:493 length:477 start_codon:yes stop_codon:yes gene_type:complete